MTRRPAVVKVQIARRELQLDDAAYRALLERVTGRTSSTACTDAQLGLVLDELKAKGWAPSVVAGGQKARKPESQKPARAPASNPVAKKARAMWISLHQLGEVRDPSESALEAFGRRQLGVDRLQWTNQSQGFRLIEALKAMAERAGWSQDLAGVGPTIAIRVLKGRLAEALFNRAFALGAVTDLSLQGWAVVQGLRFCEGDVQSWPAYQVDRATQLLAERIREGARPG